MGAHLGFRWTKIDQIRVPYWHSTVDSLITSLESNPGGLTTAQAQQRLAQFGPNQLSHAHKSAPFLLFINQFKSPIVLLLILATIISAFVKDWVDALVILIIILGSASLSFVQEYNANKSAEILRAQVSHKALVRRDGKIASIAAEQVVPGDVVVLSAGSLIPADCVILEAKDFFVNQAVLTGETFPVEKKVGILAESASLAERSNTVFMGTNVTSGEAEALVVQTGTRTVFGQIAHKLNLRPPETEFERGIWRLGYLLSEIMLFLVLIIFAFNIFLHKPFLDSLLFSIALAVGLTPQLLPAIININLSRGSQAMAQNGVIVRRLAAIENFGSMDILCTDKTGTLTVGVVQLDKTLDAQQNPSEDVHRLAYLNAFFQSGMINPLDQAIVNSFEDEQKSKARNFLKIDEIPYDFVRKRLSVIVQDSAIPDSPLILISKGAFENVLAVCTQIHQNGLEIPLTKDIRAELENRFNSSGLEGFRVLGLATRQFPAAEAGTRRTFHKDDEDSMTFMGFLEFFDPPKGDVQETIQQLAKLGVALKIITGDNKPVAIHAARSVGMEPVGVMTGSELNRMSDEALLQSAERSNLFVEVDPNQKERILMALRKMGHVVGYMGDGINDAPSLHNADVGISVDNAVDVAKEAADFILLKNDLTVLKQGIIQGRMTFANTLKYVFMATSANFGNMFSMAGASLLLPFLPMLPKQILLINFFTDLPEMTISGDKVDDSYIQRPHRWSIDFIRRFMLVFGPLSSVFDFITFGVLLWGLRASQAAFHTGWFIESVLSATIVVFALRTKLPFYKSQPSKLMVSMTLIVIFVTLLLPITPLAGLLGFTPLPIGYYLIIGVIAISYFLCAELTKRWFFRHFNN